MDITERRRTERRPAADNRARLLWDEGQEIRETTALLIDVGGGGARFVALEPPPVGRDVCFRLEKPRSSGWVKVRVVRFGEMMQGGLSFAGSFSQHLIAGLV